MKFQNSSIHGFKVMLCIKKRDERTDGRTDRRTDGRTNNPEAICPSNFFEVGGIKNSDVDGHMDGWTDRWTENVKTVYPPHKQSLRGGIKIS